MKTIPKVVAGAVWLLVCAQTASATATNRYVVKDNPGALAPYDALTNAAADIQTAINYAYAGETVLVTAATYDVGGTKVGGRYLTNRVYISKAITVRSYDNDPANTIIKGAWDPVTTNGWLAIRCVYMANNSSLVGFTLTNGATIRTNEVADSALGVDGCGGGVCAQSSSATISNCIVANNASYGWNNGGQFGGGINNGTVYQTTVRNNSTVLNGGGMGNVVAYDCTIAGNSAGGTGGGAQYSLLRRCVVSNNTSVGAGGGVFGAGAGLGLYDCTVVNNRTTAGTGHGGGAASTDSSPLLVLSNCVVAFNYAGGAGGGVRMGTLFNCVVVSNRNAAFGPNGVHQSYASNSTFIANLSNNSYKFYNCLFIGVGVVSYTNLYNCTAVGCSGSGFTPASGTISLYNCISWSNSAADSGVNAFNSCGVGNAYTNTLLGNTTHNPWFVADGSGTGTNVVAGNYRLSAASPCINTGLVDAWMTGAKDLDGNDRVDRGSLLVDMGCYERVFPGGTLIQVR